MKQNNKKRNFGTENNTGKFVPEVKYNKIQAWCCENLQFSRKDYTTISNYYYIEV